MHPIPLGWYEIPNESKTIKVESSLKSIIKPTDRNTQQESENQSESESVQVVAPYRKTVTECGTSDNTKGKCAQIGVNSDIKVKTVTIAVEEEPRKSKRKKKPPSTKNEDFVW